MKGFRANFDLMATKCIFSTFDLKYRFFQVELEESSRDFTAIRNVVSLRRYIRLPQGLKIWLAVFQRIADFILGNRKWVECLSVHA